MGKIWIGAPRRRRRKRNKRVRKRRYKSNNVMVSQVSPFPTGFITKLRYSETFELNPSATEAAVARVFRASDLYDPDFTGAGHQPLGFDNIMAIYDHFHVLGSRVRVTFSSATSSSTTGIAHVGVSLSDSQTPTLTADTWREQPRTRYRVMPNVYAGSGATLTYNYSAKKFFNVKNVKDVDKLQGTASASPTENAFFYCLASSVGGAQDPNAINCVITIEYIAYFSEPKQLAQS